MNTLVFRKFNSFLRLEIHCGVLHSASNNASNNGLFNEVFIILLNYALNLLFFHAFIDIFVNQYGSISEQLESNDYEVQH